MAASTPAQRRSLWFAALAGPIAWSVYFLAGYSLLEAACSLPLRAGSPRGAGLGAVSSIVLALTIATVLVTVYAGWLAYTHRRRLERVRVADKPQAANHPAAGGTFGGRLDADTQRFMAVSGILLSALFGFLTIATGAPPLVLASCG